MAKERKIPTFSPAEREQIDYIQSETLGRLNSPKPQVDPRPRARPLAPGEDRIFNWNKGGMVKGGSYTVPAMCGGGKVIKSWGK